MTSIKISTTVSIMRAGIRTKIVFVLLAGLLGLLTGLPAQAQGLFFLTLTGANPNPVVVGKTITLSGMAFPNKPVVCLTPTDNLFVGPQTAKVTSASNNQVVAQLPEAMCEGKYDIVIKDANSAYQTNTLPIVVNPAKPALYEVALQSITCVKESHDFSDSDEIYFMGLSYDTAKATLTPTSTMVYEDVNAGWAINPGHWENLWPWLPLLKEWVAKPDQCIVECALAECDNYVIHLPYLLTEWDDDFGASVSDYGWKKTINAQEDIEGKYLTTLLNPGYPRGYKSLLMQMSMENAIWDTTGDDVLGLFELTWKAADVELARKYYDKPYLKVVDVYGDSSHYKMSFLLIRMQ